MNLICICVASVALESVVMVSINKISVYFILFTSLFIGQSVFQNLSYIQDEVLLQTVREYIELCPYVDLCYLTSNKTYPESAFIEFIIPASCCRSCSCVDGCGDACCPDKPSGSLTDNEVRDLKKDIRVAHCRRSQYKEVRESDNLIKNTAYRTVTKCPTGYGNNDTKTKCIQESREFGFQDGVSDFVPVSNTSTIFKNKYCAICNGVDLESIEFWRIELYCESGTGNQAVNSVLQLMDVLDNNNCDLFFSPPSQLSVHTDHTCMPLIDRCNVTGHWTQYNVDTERACLSYESVYFNYKNVHCFLCNKRPDDAVQEVCGMDAGYDPNSFVALLDFRGMQDNSRATPERSSEDCPEGYGFDSLQNECRQLICPDYMYISQGECKSLVQSVEEYDVIFTLEPRDVRNQIFLSESMEILHSALSHIVFYSLKTKQSEFSICQLSGFMFLRNTIFELVDSFLADNRKHLKFSEIESFAFRLQLSGNAGMNMTRDLRNLDSLFDNYNQIPGLSPYIIRFRNIPVELFEQSSDAYDEYQWNASPTRDALLNTVTLDKVLHNALGASFNSSTNGFTIAPIPSDTVNYACNSVAKYQVQPFCAKIELSADGFRVDDDGVMIPSINLFLPNTDIVFTFNNTILVCYKTYMSWIGYYQNGDNLKMKPIMILTAICIALSLISLVLTFIVYALFKQLRTLPGLNIMSLVGCLFFTHLLTLINGIIKIESAEGCIAFGIVLHFSLMLSIFWMFICTFHMAKVFVNLKKVAHHDINRSRLFIRYVAFTTTASLSFVVTNIVVSSVRTHNASIGYDDKVCYLDSTVMVLFTVAIPVGFVVVANIGMFLCVMVKVGNIPIMDTNRHNERNNITIFAKLSTITGITWIFGFLYQFTSTEALAYIFVVLNASQGIFIMVAFVLNRRVFGMLKSCYFSHITLHSTEQSALHSSKTNSFPDRHHSDEHHCQTKL